MLILHLKILLKIKLWFKKKLSVLDFFFISFHQKIIVFLTWNFDVLYLLLNTCALEAYP